MKYTLAAASLAITCFAQGVAAGPVRLYARADQACSASIPLPQAQFVYKLSEGKPAVRSCEIRVARETFRQRFGACSLNTMVGGDCALSESYAGGRMVQISVISRPDADAAVCGYTCFPN